MHPRVDISAQGTRARTPDGTDITQDMENTSRDSDRDFEQFSQFCTEFRNSVQSCTEFFSFACASFLFFISRGKMPQHHRASHPVELVGAHIPCRQNLSSCLLRGGSLAAKLIKIEILRKSTLWETLYRILETLYRIQEIGKHILFATCGSGNNSNQYPLPPNITSWSCRFRICWLESLGSHQFCTRGCTEFPNSVQSFQNAQFCTEFPLAQNHSKNSLGNM